MDTSLNWDDLKYFDLVATTLSIREAAEQSTMSAATLSRRIANLEEKLGEALFIRRANRLTLTPLGKDILAQVHQVRTQVQSIEERCAVRPGRRKIRIKHLICCRDGRCGHLCRCPMRRGGPFRRATTP